MKRVCVFCGSRHGEAAVYAERARELGVVAARRGLGIVYGGGRVGLMGELADAALAAGGEVTGVIPRMLKDREVGHEGTTALHVVETMHERKALMASLADAFVALPGGIGTFEETFEVWTWAQLGTHAKPLGLLDVDGFYRPLLDFLDGVVARGFLEPRWRDRLLVDTDPGRLLDRLRDQHPEPAEPWVDPSRT